MYRMPFPAWACDVTVKPGRGITHPDRAIPHVLVTPTVSTDEEGFTQATVDTADMYLVTPGQTPPTSTDRVEVPATHPLHGLYQVEGEPDPWPLGIHVSLRRIHG